MSTPSGELERVENAYAQLRVVNPSFEASPSGQNYAARIKVLREKAENEETVKIAKMLEKKGLAPHGTAAAAQVIKLEAEMKDKDSEIAKLKGGMRTRDIAIQNYKDAHAKHKKTIEDLNTEIKRLDFEHGGERLRLENELSVTKQRLVATESSLRDTLSNVAPHSGSGDGDAELLAAPKVRLLDVPPFIVNATSCSRTAGHCRALQVERLFVSENSDEHKAIQGEVDDCEKLVKSAQFSVNYESSGNLLSVSMGRFFDITTVSAEEMYDKIVRASTPDEVLVVVETTFPSSFSGTKGKALETLLLAPGGYQWLKAVAEIKKAGGRPFSGDWARASVFRDDEHLKKHVWDHTIPQFFKAAAHDVITKSKIEGNMYENRLVQEARKLAIGGKPSELAEAYNKRGKQQRDADDEWARTRPDFTDFSFNGDDYDDNSSLRAAVTPPPGDGSDDSWVLNTPPPRPDGQCLELSRFDLTPSGNTDNSDESKADDLVGDHDKFLKTAKESKAGVLENKETGDFDFVELREVSIPRTHKLVHPLVAHRAGSKVLTTLTKGAHSFVNGKAMTLSDLSNMRESDIITRDNFCDLFHGKAEDGVFRLTLSTSNSFGRKVTVRERAEVLEEAARECALITNIEKKIDPDKFPAAYFAHTPGTAGGDCLHRLPGVHPSVCIELTKKCKLETHGSLRVGFMADGDYRDMVMKK